MTSYQCSNLTRLVGVPAETKGGNGMTSCQCRNLTHLVGVPAETYAQKHLKMITIDSENWVTLFRCPQTGRFWKESYPHSGMHGGGPPELVQISAAVAKEEFHFSK